MAADHDESCTESDGGLGIGSSRESTPRRLVTDGGILYPKSSEGWIHSLDIFEPSK